MEEIFIGKVRQYEFLYNKYLRDYRDQNMRQEAWDTIGIELNMSGTQVKDKWTKLRNSYSNALRRRNSKRSDTKEYVPWKYEKQMAFLQPYLDLRPSNLLGDPLEMDDHYQLEQIKFHPSPITKEEADFGDYPVDEHDESSDTSTTPGPSVLRKRTADTASGQPPRKKVFQIQQSQEHPYSLDESDMFYLSMSKNAKKLPEIDQAKIRMEICKLVSEAQIRNIQDQSALPV